MDTTVSPSHEKKKPRTPLENLLINRNYAYNWVGLTFSRLGNVVFDVALLLWVATTLARNAPWAAFAIGCLVFLPTVMFLLSGTFAGVYVDRWDARRTQLFLDAARVVLFTLLLIVTMVHLPFPAGSGVANVFQLVCVFIALMISGAFDPFVNSALAVLLYDIVAEPDLPRAFGRGQVLNNIGTILGPPLGAAIFFAFGIQWTIFLNILSFAISFFAFYMIRMPRKDNAALSEDKAPTEEKQKRSFLREFLEGIRYTFSNRLIVAILVAMMLITAGGAGIAVFDLYFATNNLHVAPQIYPYLDVVLGAGAIVGALFVGPRLQPRFGLRKVFWVSVLMTGLLFLVYARMTNLIAAFVLLFLLGTSQAVSSVVFGPLLFIATPRNIMGRVNSVLAQLLTIVSLLSVSVVPILITIPLHDKLVQFSGLFFGPIDTLFTAVAILVITSALYLRITLNDYVPVVKQSEEQQPGDEEQEEHVEFEYQPQKKRFSTLQQQLSICIAGVIIVVLVVLPVALSTSPSAVSTLLLSHGQPANGQPVDGMPCLATPGSAELANVRLTIYINGQEVGIPTGVGSVAPPQPGVAALASRGHTTCLYPLNVLESDNIIQVNSATERTYTLGEFFDLWGQPLSSTQVANYIVDQQHPLVFDVFDPDGQMQTYAGDPRSLPLVEHETIVIVYNSPHASLVPYSSWNGL
jgi:MFS family permease